jgi:dTDP-4-dehydrorhamnose 3,5-epimerase
MQFEKTPLEGCVIITPQVFGDNRGEFVLNFNKKEFEKEIGKEVNFVIENQSTSKYGVIRGLHLQKGKDAQAKLIRVSQGKILDVAVDFRKESPTYLQHFSVVISKENKKQLFVPRGFLHGFSVLEDDTTVVYKCDNYYNPESEFGIMYNDETLGIDWKINIENVDLSNKDKKLIKFNELI